MKLRYWMTHRDGCKFETSHGVADVPEFDWNDEAGRTRTYNILGNLVPKDWLLAGFCPEELAKKEEQRGES